MRKTRNLVLVGLLLCASASIACGQEVWNWTLPFVVRDWTNPLDHATDSAFTYFYLTDNNGSHAVAMTQYASGGNTKVWTSILTNRWNPSWDENNLRGIGNVRAFEYEDIGADWRHWDPSGTWPFTWDYANADQEKVHAVNLHVANNAKYKTFSWGNINLLDNTDWPDGYGSQPPNSDPDLTYQSDDFWYPPHDFCEGAGDTLGDFGDTLFNRVTGPQVQQ